MDPLDDALEDLSFQSDEWTVMVSGHRKWLVSMEASWCPDFSPNPLPWRLRFSGLPSPNGGTSSVCVQDL